MTSKDFDGDASPQKVDERTANRREGVWGRAGEPSVTFCGKKERHS